MTKGKGAALLCAALCLTALAAPTVARAATHSAQAIALPHVLVVGAEDEGTKRAWLGVSIADISDEIREKQGLPKGVVGALVLEVYDGSPAEKAGIKDDDVITALAGAKVGSISDLVGLVSANAPGATVDVTVLRDGKETSFGVTLAERAKSEKAVWVGELEDLEDLEDLEGLEALEALKQIQVDVNIPSFELGLSGMYGRGRLGVYIDDLSEGLADYFGVPGGKGALVEDVVEDSPASKGGVLAGDIIVKLGDEKVEDASSLREAISEMEPGKETPVVIWRKGKELTLRVAIEESEEIQARKAFIKQLGDDAGNQGRIIIRGAEKSEQALREQVKALEEVVKQLEKEVQQLKEESGNE